MHLHTAHNNFPSIKRNKLPKLNCGHDIQPDLLYWYIRIVHIHPTFKYLNHVGRHYVFEIWTHEMMLILPIVSTLTWNYIFRLCTQLLEKSINTYTQQLTTKLILKHLAVKLFLLNLQRLGAIWSVIQIIKL